jgi:membrane associated rhomboid family serine protease
MGIYDRDYYRREGPSFLGGLDRGRVCVWLLGINIVVFILQMATVRHELIIDPVSGEPLARVARSLVTQALDLDVPKVLHGEVWRLLTYSFLHSTATIWHIFWNMLILWWFGRDVEDLYGSKEFLAFYLMSALLSAVAYCVAYLVGIYSVPAVGASGAVTAVVTLYACHYPRQTILLFFILPVPIWLFVAATIAMDLFNVFGQANNGVAAAAHVGGAGFALLYFWQHWRLLNLMPQLQSWRRRQARPRLRVYREEETPVAVTAAPPPPPGRPEDELLEAKMDAVLEKISRVGKENLTDGDREVLRLAAEAIKRRRG